MTRQMSEEEKNYVEWKIMRLIVQALNITFFNQDGENPVVCQIYASPRRMVHQGVGKTIYEALSRAVLERDRIALYGVIDGISDSNSSG